MDAGVTVHGVQGVEAVALESVVLTVLAPRPVEVTVMVAGALVLLVKVEMVTAIECVLSRRNRLSPCVPEPALGVILRDVAPVEAPEVIAPANSVNPMLV
jgi:hypothetical protein